MRRLLHDQTELQARKSSLVIQPGFEPELPTPKDDVLPLHHWTMVWATGFGPAASCAQGTRSTRLSYTQTIARSTITTGWNILIIEGPHPGEPSDVLCTFWYRWHAPSQGLDVRHRPVARIAITLESTTLNSSRALTPYDRWLRSMERCPLLVEPHVDRCHGIIRLTGYRVDMRFSMEPGSMMEGAPTHLQTDGATPPLFFQRLRTA